MANKELKKLLDEVAVVRADAEMDLTDCPPNVYMGKATAKAYAIENLAEVEKKYTDALVPHIVKVFVKHETPELTGYLHKNGAIVLNGNLLYDWLANQLHNPPVFAPNHTIQVMDCLMEFCRNNSIESIPMPKWGPEDVEVKINSREHLVELLKKGIRATNGNDLTRFLMVKYANLQAIKAKIDFNLVPVVILGLQDDEITGLSDTLFKDQPSVILDVGDKQFSEVEAILNKELQAAYAALKRVNKENKNG